jgi:hypothetical protein
VLPSVTVQRNAFVVFVAHCSNDAIVHFLIELLSAKVGECSRLVLVTDSFPAHFLIRSKVKTLANWDNASYKTQKAESWPPPHSFQHRTPGRTNSF